MDRDYGGSGSPRSDKGVGIRGSYAPSRGNHPMRLSADSRTSVDISHSEMEWHAASLKKKFQISMSKPRFVANLPVFKAMVDVTVIVNAIQMGMAADLSSPGWQNIWDICDHVFTTVFMLEMFFMMSAYKASYFKDAWLLFDGFVALLSAFNTWFLPLAGREENIGFLRQFRLIRLLRIAKITRVVPELHVVVEGLINSMKSMLWIFVLLFVMLYACAVLCVEVLGRSSSGYPGYSDDQQIIKQQVYIDNKWNNYEFFGTVPRAIMTLFGMVLLSEWPIVRQVMELHVMLVPMFTILVVLVAFGVLNVIIGIVVEKTTKAMETLRRESEDKAQQARAKTAKQLTDILFRFDVDGDSRLGVEELQSSVEDEDFRKLLIKLNLPENYSPMEFLRMLDVNGSGKLSKTEFVNGMLRLIYSTGFQRQCNLLSSVGMLHHELKRVHVELRNEIHELLGNAVQELRIAVAPESLVTRDGAWIGLDAVPGIRDPQTKFDPNTTSTVSSPSANEKGSFASLFNNESSNVCFEMDAPDARPDALHSSWNPIQSHGFVFTSANPEPVISGGEEDCTVGDVSEKTVADAAEKKDLSSWEPLKTAFLVPIRVDNETGHMIRASRSDTKRFKDQQLMGFVPMMSLGRDLHGCQGQGKGKVVSSKSSSEQDLPLSSKRLYKI